MLKLKISKTIDFAGLFACSMLSFHVLSLVFALMSRNKGKFLCPTPQQVTRVSMPKHMEAEILKEDDYPDVQTFMATYRKVEAVVEQYNRKLAE